MLAEKLKSPDLLMLTADTYDLSYLVYFSGVGFILGIVAVCLKQRIGICAIVLAVVASVYSAFFPLS